VFYQYLGFVGMDIATLTAFLSPFLPFLLKLGGKAIDKSTESAAGKLGEAAFGKAQAVWGKLGPSVEAKEAAKEAAIDVANSPEDGDLWVALKVQLQKLLEQDEELGRAIAVWDGWCADGDGESEFGDWSDDGGEGDWEC
jgi:hypothetical protein